MNSLTQRLRQAWRSLKAGTIEVPELLEAADVIEDLEEENADLYGELNHRSIDEHQQRNWLEEHKSFTQQVKALRGALREIVEFDAPNYKWVCQNMRRIAREALDE